MFAELFPFTILLSTRWFAPPDPLPFVRQTIESCLKGILIHLISVTLKYFKNINLEIQNLNNLYQSYPLDGEITSFGIVLFTVSFATLISEEKESNLA